MVGGGGMNTDIRISVSFRNHRKRRKLRIILGENSTDYLLDLWISTAMNHPSGRLEGMDEVDIALEAGWEKDPTSFVEALMKCGFLEKDQDGTYFLHDWDDHQGYAIHAQQRSDKAKKAALARWNATSIKDNATSIQNDATSNAPSPTPTPAPAPAPTPTPKQKTVVVEEAATPIARTHAQARATAAAAAALDCGIVEYANPIARASPSLSLESIEKIREVWNEKCKPYDISQLAPVRKWPEKRLTALKDFWKYQIDGNIDAFGKIIDHLLTNPLMIGKTEPKPGYDKPWSMTLDWVLDPDNSIKVLEDF